MRVERINIRTLAEFSYLSGDLYAEGQNAARMREGMLNHQAVQSGYADDMHAEVPLELTVSTKTCDLVISGRADGLSVGGEGVVVEEIKSVSLGQGLISPDMYPAHWAQAEGYAHMACEKFGAKRALVRLIYVHALDTKAVTRFTREFTAEQLAIEFEKMLTPYANWLDAQVKFQDVRDASISALKFPFGGYRAGQRKMAVSAFIAIRDKHKLLVQAPTGIGKTAGAIFPALKALGAGHVTKLMYLTARRTTRQAAQDCIELLRRGGLRVRYCALTAKEQICLKPGARCVPESCEFCVGYYDKRRRALDDALDMTDYNAETIRELAKKHGICPFEFSLELCQIADVIICDYNYVFDPNVYLRRFFTTKAPFALLIDEAHNLETRTRDMLSAELRFSDYVALRRDIGVAVGRQTGEYKLLTELLKAWKTFGEGRAEAGFDSVKPDALVKACMDFTDATSPSLPYAVDFAAKWAEKWFQLLNFARVGDMYSAERYATLYEPTSHGINVTQLCVDSSTHIKKCLAKVRSTVLFSATLSPPKYYFSALGLNEDDGDAYLELPSPFLSENFLVRRLNIPTRYSQRTNTLGAIADALGVLALSQTGNFIACFPSYAYLRAVAAVFREKYPDIDAMEQQPSMKDDQRQEFLAKFAPQPQKSMMAFIAMGGIFSEGIDLPGDRLSGAAIIGVGLPQVCLEREALRAHFDKTTGDGFNYAYVYPGICKVLQAAGRVIRTEDDSGAALLIDDRFFREPYSELFPRHWHVESARVNELPRLLKRFWMGQTY